jgi:cytokinesis protein
MYDVRILYTWLTPYSKVGKLNIYRNADPEELAGLHPSDRLMVKLIQINRLGPRIEGMLYRSGFEETWSLLDDVRSFRF